MTSGDVPPQFRLGIDLGGTSVKLGLFSGEELLWTARQEYRRPSATQLLEAIRVAAGGRAQDCAVGLCVPGILDERRERVTYSANVPALHELRLEELAAAALGAKPRSLRIINDTLACAADIHATRQLPGRLLVITLGGGVGVAVLDNGIPLSVDGDSPGHLGQIDVSWNDERPIGPDGGAGSLEAYIGAAALRQRYGEGADIAAVMAPDDPPMLALARAIRICHAIYRPNHIVLAGGLGIRLGRFIEPLRARIQKDLTRVAQPTWTLGVGHSDFHAACGAARLAASATAS